MEKGKNLLCFSFPLSCLFRPKGFFCTGNISVCLIVASRAMETLSELECPKANKNQIMAYCSHRQNGVYPVHEG